VLVVNGADDRLRARSIETAAALGNARIAVVEGAGHVAHLERPDDVNRAIEEFVAAL
jgi:pimeloyl-ACP methyl ester carboxylesterase